MGPDALGGASDPYPVPFALPAAADMRQRLLTSYAACWLGLVPEAPVDGEVAGGAGAAQALMLEADGEGVLHRNCICGHCCDHGEADLTLMSVFTRHKRCACILAPQAPGFRLHRRGLCSRLGIPQQAHRQARLSAAPCYGS